MNDGLIFGESRETRALVMPPQWFRDRPDYSPLVFTFMNRAATELAKTHPDKYLGCLAYYWCENVPPFAVHPQVVPFLTADRAQGYDPAFWREEMALQERWGRLAGASYQLSVTGTAGAGRSGSSPDNRERITHNSPPRRLGLYDYLYGGGYLIPRIYPHLLAEHLKHARRAGFTDYYAECNPNWGLDGPMPWLAAQLLQDPEQPVDALLDEYYARYFQEAAEPMRAFFTQCEKLWLEQPRPGYWLKHYRNESQVVIFPAVACAELRKLLDDAAQRAHSGKVKERVGLVSAAFGVTERLVALGGARNELVRAVIGYRLSVVGDGGRNASATDNRELLTNDLARYLAARRDFIRYTTDVQRALPLAIAKFTWDDYLRNDPVGAALLALARRASASELAMIDPEIERLGWADATAIWRALRAGDGGRTTEGGGRRTEGGGQRTEGGGRRAESGGRKAEDDGGRTTNNQEPITDNSPLPAQQLLRNPTFLGEIKPARTIADLRYGAALPAEWASSVEPAQFQKADVVEDTTPSAFRPPSSAVRPPPSALRRLIRLSGNKDTAISQWNQVQSRGLHEASVALRGKVSPGARVTLTFAWLDDKQRHLGFKAVRLPDGEWPEWVTLEQAGLPPSGAAWVGMGIRVEHQVPGDFIEARDFSLLAR